MEQSLGVQVPLRVPFLGRVAYIAQSVEHILGKDEVSGSSPDVGSIFYFGGRSARGGTDGLYQ